MKSDLQRPGTRLERLVAILERTLASSGALIEAPSRRLRDRDTGSVREHDVLIIWDHGHHQIVTAIECRDRSRPVGVPDVEAFADKCLATGVHSAVIVSGCGFRKSALKKAEVRAITCMQLEEVEQFDWLLMDSISEFRRHFETIDAKIMFLDQAPEDLVAFYDTAGNELTEQMVLQTIINAVPPAEDAASEVGVHFPLRMRVNTVNWTAKDRQGKLWPVDHILARGSFTTIETVRPSSGTDTLAAGETMPSRVLMLRLGTSPGSS